MRVTLIEKYNWIYIVLWELNFQFVMKRNKAAKN